MRTGANELWAALALGSVSSVGLLVGAVAGSFSRLRHQRIAMAMSVGAGLLLAGVSLKVAADAIRIAGPMAAALSLVLGAAAFSASNALLARFGAAHRKRCGECIEQPVESQQPGSGVAIGLGNALDAAPEALVLGIALRDPVVPVALVIAFSLGNLPVALSSTAGLRAVHEISLVRETYACATTRVVRRSTRLTKPLRSPAASTMAVTCGVHRRLNPSAASSE